ncbi:MAG: DUF4872 domain-containing protein [Chloroflexi bacterium]|nr:DUF4872 domain-containing protein [Chloroflexota bacterium]MCY3582797.1 DUF4872 domain-containing protein [Chloroflexota bacterium]MCY3717823.1 DUF4872 domain-containing protein [Chloroflexota bacterium]MDE2649247.1 DUF4872 domain-containing protein [Chloroflexota bacterium]MXV93096.1 DUF4872 domain-containing protein [Chloroflexota bacterium]
MPTLPNFTQFDGRYWDTGSIRNALDYQGSAAPHTGKAYDEAMLLGISGGIAFGYFTFHYQGYDPQVNLLTRNTFEPMQRICERLGIEVKWLRAASVERMRQNLTQSLEAGQAPIAHPDMYLLEYNCLEGDAATWGAMPLVVFGYEPGGAAMLSDRSAQPLTVPAKAFDRAMSRVKKDRHGLMLLGHPDNERLPTAMRAGLRDAVQLMLEKPPKGAARNFGVKALAHWQKMLGGTGKGSWAKEYSYGRACLAAHTSAYRFLTPAFGKTWAADRDSYADFLRQAAAVLGENDLIEVAALYDEAGAAWQCLLDALLPADAALLRRARELIDHGATTFIAEGGAGLATIADCRDELAGLMQLAEADFPLDESDMAEIRANLRESVARVEATEARAILALKAACVTIGAD